MSRVGSRRPAIGCLAWPHPRAPRSGQSPGRTGATTFFRRIRTYPGMANDRHTSAPTPCRAPGATDLAPPMRRQAGMAMHKQVMGGRFCFRSDSEALLGLVRSEEHTSELQSLMRISYAVFCLKKKNTHQLTHIN